MFWFFWVVESLLEGVVVVWLVVDLVRIFVEIECLDIFFGFNVILWVDECLLGVVGVGSFLDIFLGVFLGVVIVVCFVNLLFFFWLISVLVDVVFNCFEVVWIVEGFDDDVFCLFCVFMVFCIGDDLVGMVDWVVEVLMGWWGVGDLVGGRVLLVGLLIVEVELIFFVLSWVGSFLVFVSVGVGVGEGVFELVCYVCGFDDGIVKRLVGCGWGLVFNILDESKVIGEFRVIGMLESDCFFVLVLFVVLGGIGVLFDGVVFCLCCVVEGFGFIGVVEFCGFGREYDEGFVSWLLFLDCLGLFDGFGCIFIFIIDGIEDGLCNDEVDKDLCCVVWGLCDFELLGRVVFFFLGVGGWVNGGVCVVWIVCLVLVNVGVDSLNIGMLNLEF